MDAEEGEITLTRQTENAPELNTPDSIFKSVSICSPEIEFSKVLTHIIFPHESISCMVSDQHCDKQTVFDEAAGSSGPQYCLHLQQMFQVFT